MTGYVDGVEGLTKTSDFTYDASSDPALAFGLGARYQTGGNFFGRTPDGTFDDVSIWQGALSADQIGMLASGVSPLLVPEPSALVLLAAGLCGRGLGRRRQRTE